MSSRSIIAIVVGLVALACVCGLAVVVLSGAAAYVLASRPAIATEAPPSTPIPITGTSAPDFTPGVNDDANAEMDAIEQQVKDLRGWDSTQPVPRNFYSQDQLRDYNLEWFEKDYSPEEARDDVLSLAAFGMMDPSFDLYDFYIDLYSEGILGMYDDDVAELFIISERGLGAVERGTFAHEYLHALQDQNHGFEALGWTDEAFDTDAQRFGALQAFIEGEAMVLETQWENQYFTDADWDDYNNNAYADPDSAIYRAPEWLQKDFYFPYLQGFDFVQALYDRGGWAEVDEAYTRLPASTEQILHLDKYDANEAAVDVPAPAIVDALGSDWRVIDTNNQGEWYTTLVLEQFINESDAATAAAGWGGDRYTVAYNDTTGQTVAAWQLAWDTNGDAEEFVDAFKDYGDARFGAIAEVGDGKICWNTPDLASCLFFTPNATLWVLAPDEATLETVRAAIAF